MASLRKDCKSLASVEEHKSDKERLESRHMEWACRLDMMLDTVRPEDFRLIGWCHWVLLKSETKEIWITIQSISWVASREKNREIKKNRENEKIL